LTLDVKPPSHVSEELQPLASTTASASISPPHLRTRPIGVLDSGVGGLSVLRCIRNDLPAENLLYVADSGHAPYGNKSPQFIETRCIAITQFLIDAGAKAIVVACNTATAVAINSLREKFTLPIIGVEPAVKPAVEATRSGVIGVLATSGTLESGRFAGLAARVGSTAKVIVQPCPGLVEQVEQGDLNSEATRTLLASFVTPLLEQGADTLVLGCTHYPFLAPLLRELIGDNVTLIETSGAVSRQLMRRLSEANLLAEVQVGSDKSGSAQFWSSGNPQQLENLLSQLWGSTSLVKAY